MLRLAETPPHPESALTRGFRPLPARGERSSAGALISIPRQRDAVVDQVVDALLHVDIGRDHAGLLQGETGGEDSVQLEKK